MEYEKKVQKKKAIQEKISFVKMEYFLYGFTQAHRLMKEIQALEKTINKVERDVDEIKNEIKVKKEEQRETN